MINDEALLQLKSVVFKVQALGDIEWNDFKSIWQQVSEKRKSVLTATGQTEKYLYFVIEGVQRAFYLKEKDNKEATLVFTYTGSFSGVLDSFLLQQPSKYFLETLSASTFLRASYQQVYEVMMKHRNIESFIRKSLAITLAGLLERQIELQSFSAEERFRVLLNRSPHVLQIIPQKYLASYLGLDATTFSKLMATVKI